MTLTHFLTQAPTGFLIKSFFFFFQKQATGLWIIISHFEFLKYWIKILFIYWCHSLLKFLYPQWVPQSPHTSLSPLCFTCTFSCNFPHNLVRWAWPIPIIYGVTEKLSNLLTFIYVLKGRVGILTQIHLTPETKLLSAHCGPY